MGASREDLSRPTLTVPRWAAKTEPMARTKSVAATELRARLGAVLRSVRQGTTVVVTERGKPIAELRPLAAPDANPGLARLIAEGIVTPPSQPGGLKPFRPIRLKGGATLSDAIIEDREDRF